MKLGTTGKIIDGHAYFKRFGGTQELEIQIWMQ
jgi:hypothetical protein